MSSKYAFGALIVLAMCVMLFPRAVQCADWTVSPFRAQLASADETGQSDQQVAAADSSTSAVANPLKKNIGRAALFSLIIPGTGELYAGSWVRALPFFAAEVVGWTYFAMYQGKGNTKTNSFESYAGWRDTPNNFDTHAYMYAEYLIASDSIRSNIVGGFHGDFGQWQAMSWDDRYPYLPAPFTHDVMTDDRQQFFEMIGKYLLQFGWGWKDTYNSGNGWDVTGFPLANWQQPASGLTADNSNTIEFDGQSPMFFHYRDMRGLTNSYYNKANIAMEVVLVNHLLSAFDAAFAVRNANRHLEAQSSPKLGHIHLQYEAKPTVSGDMARYMTVSVPLN
jgi:hypothetical protein